MRPPAPNVYEQPPTVGIATAQATVSTFFGPLQRATDGHPTMSTGFQGLGLTTARAERRRFTRLTCGDGYVRIVVLLGTEPCTAIVRDISAGGIGVLVDAIIAPGDWLNVEFGSPARDAWYRKMVQVSHASPAQGDRWLVGGAFTQPLTIEEFRQLLPHRHVDFARGPPP